MNSTWSVLRKAVGRKNNCLKHITVIVLLINITSTNYFTTIIIKVDCPFKNNIAQCVLLLLRGGGGGELKEFKAQSTYICSVQSCVWRLPILTPHPPLHPASVSPPPPKAGGGGGTHTLAGRLGGGGSIFWKTPDIGLAS